MTAQGDAIETRLLDQLHLVNDWLKFAETKNVGIVGLASGGLAVVIATVGFVRDEQPTQLQGMLLVGGAIALALSLLLGVYSFLPATVVPRWMRMSVGRPHPDDNLFFFGHAAKYTPAELVQAVALRYARIAEPVIHDLHTDLAAQLIINARITMQKLRLFRWAVVLFGAGVLLAGLGMLIVVVS